MADMVLQMQQGAGNAAVARLIARIGTDGIRPRRLDRQQQPGAGAATADPPARPVNAPPWLTQILIRSGAVDAAGAQELLRTAGQFAISAAMRCEEGTESPSDPQRPHLRGRGRASRINWDSLPGDITPAATPDGRNHETLRDIYLAHRNAQIQSIFGMPHVDFVLSAIAVADAADRADVRDRLEDLLFRASQYAVVEALNVSQSSRYQRTPTKTFCNIYAYDFVTAMGGYLPRVWWTRPALRRIEAGEEVVTAEEYRRRQAERDDAARAAHRERRGRGRPRTGGPLENVIAPIYGETVGELNANALNDWMRTHGARFGWREETNMNAAQQAANSGSIVVLLAANAVASRSGHISVVLAESPEHQGHRDENGQVTVPLQSQAGSRNFKYSAEAGAPGSRGRQWWSDAAHRQGAAWIFGGSIQEAVATPEQMGFRAPE